MLTERDNQPGGEQTTQPQAPKPKRGAGRNGGRPSSYNPETAKAIADAYATCSNPLHDILRANPHFPASATCWEWERLHEQFRALMSHARERRADLLIEQCMTLSDTPRLGRKVKTWKGETEVTEDDAIERTKLQVSTRLRLAKFLNPAKYGDKVEVGGTVTLEALILASMKLDEKPAKAAAAAPIEGQARARLAGPDEPGDGL